MKTRVKTGKLAVLLLTLMTLICLPLIAFADEGGSTIKVNMTVNNQGVIAVAADGSVMIEKEVTVDDLNSDGKFSYEEALIAAHKAYYKDGESGFATTMSDYGLQVTKLWGVDTTNNLFFANGAAISMNVGDTEVAAGDNLYASVNADNVNWCDVKSDFNNKNLTAEVGGKVNVILTGFIGMEGGEAKGLSGIKLGYWKDGAFVEIPGAVTDANGAASFVPAEKGSFILTAYGTTPVTSQWSGPITAPIMAPYAFLTVGAGDLKNASITVPSVTYNGKAQTPSVTVKVGNIVLKENVDFSAAYSNNKDAGTASVTVTGKGNYTGEVKKSFTINKASQTVTVKAKTFKIKKAKVAKKKQTIEAKKVTKGNSAKTKITYSLKKANKNKKKFKVASSGKITVGKGLKKGTYKLTIKAAAAAGKNYKAVSKTFKVTIKVN